MISLIAIVGPTASGKTVISIRLAEILQTEIVSADSMQFYCGMEIGTAAPTPDDLACVKHHFVGFLDPAEDFSAGAFEAQAREIVMGLNAQGKPAVVVGGSGLYIRALIDGLFSGPGKDEAIRARLHDEAKALGVPALYARLEQVDLDYARVINPNDLRRIVRALEVHEITGRPLSELHREHRAAMQPINAVQVALDYPRDVLYDRINTRVDRMLELGLLDEVRALLDKGYGPDIDRLRSLGYREIIRYLHGECPLDEAIENIKLNTRHYAKRQLTWFRADPRIRWVPVTAETSEDSIIEVVCQEAVSPVT